MKLTLLLDLDDTLLDNKMETFIPAYLGALGQHLSAHLDLQKLGPVMMSATEEMFKNTQIDRTLKETFSPHFYPALDLDEAQVRPDIARFYAEVFPTLRGFTKPQKATIPLIREAERRNWRVAIATNPIFPQAAIRHRLEWAGIPAGQHDFTVIPSYEQFHFAKPNPAFFAELLARIGWPEGKILMVGNDPDHDIRGASQMGIATFWISNGQPYPEGFPAPKASGKLEDLLPWLDSVSEEALTPNYRLTSAITATLHGIPAALLMLTDGIPPEIWERNTPAGNLNLTEIVSHLRDVEREVNLPRLEKIVREANPFIPGVDADAWIATRKYHTQNGSAALREFIAARKQTLALLASLSPDDWARPAQHALLGPTTLHELADIIARHDRMHIRQAHTQING